VQSLSLGSCRGGFEAALRRWQEERRTERLWHKDPSIWTGTNEASWLGWLDIADKELARVHELEALGRYVAGARYTHAVVLGMGGSSLCPDVLSRSFGPRDGFPRLLVLDSTVPAQVSALTRALDLETTLFIVASKSGSTAEPNAFEKYFYPRVRSGESFLAITDPASSLERTARDKGYRDVLYGEPTIGGRFSALSRFGMGPASVQGLDARGLLERAKAMGDACGADVPDSDNPAVALGIALGSLALQGRDKLTILTSPELSSFGGWLEQLVAESTGKDGKGIVPIDGEALGAPELYREDRVFVYLGLGPSAALDPLERAGHPGIRIVLDSLDDLAGEFFRWELATAVAGSVLGLNPFDQPDVEASKVATRALMARFEERGELPRETRADPADGAPLASLLARLGPGDYFAINAFVAMNEENDRALQALRHVVRDRYRVATTLGYGPRFLHSTGQLHKGGPNRGVFLHVTAEDAEDVEIPGEGYTFSHMKRFQAAGDLEVLVARGRRVLAVHLGPDVSGELEKLRRSLGT
jgi:transaldolase/glucose-6-phosphate isomerase